MAHSLEVMFLFGKSMDYGKELSVKDVIVAIEMQ